MNTLIAPEQRTHRSFIYRKLVALGAQFVECNEAAVAATYGELQGELAAARSLGLADLSPLRRVGFKGAGAADWLVSHGLKVPEVNRVARQSDGALLLRLGANDILITTDLATTSGLPDRLLLAWHALEHLPAEPRGYPMPRQDGYCWFVLSGNLADACMAKLCAIDLRPRKFADGTIAQTFVARLSAVVARNDINGTLAYQLFADSASAEYWWDCIVDAMQEFNGKPVGLNALRGL